ncbi:MAG: hypothetical protein ACTS22_07865 [Phycisphaerales bacterium]
MTQGKDIIFAVAGGVALAGTAGAQPAALSGLSEVGGLSNTGASGATQVSSLVTEPSGLLGFDLTGTLTQAQNLAFAVINGQVRFSAPEPGDLPLFVTGTLVANGPEPSFFLQGSFTSPTRAYTFDVFVDDFADNLTVTQNTIVVSEATDSLVFDLVINRRTGTGSFSYSETVLAGGVEVVRSASGTIGSATPVPAPAAGGLLLAGSGLALRRRR